MVRDRHTLIRTLSNGDIAGGSATLITPNLSCSYILELPSYHWNG